MEKNGAIQPGKTPDTEERIQLPTPGEKQATVAVKTQLLDDDVTKRLADRAAEQLDASGS